MAPTCGPRSPTRTPEGEGKTAMMKSELSSQRITGGNDAPEFDDDQDPDDVRRWMRRTIAKRSVAENTAAGKTDRFPGCGHGR